MPTNLRIEIEREEDGRWIAEVPELPGALVYGRTREDAIAQVKVLTLIENEEPVPAMMDLFLVVQ